MNARCARLFPLIVIPILGYAIWAHSMGSPLATVDDATPIDSRQTTPAKHAAYGEGSQKLVVATGSPGEVGLLGVLTDKFAVDQDATVTWRKAGSGKSLELLREKKVDAVIVHAPEAERKAVEEGWATRRTLFGSNEFLLVGPANDPARIESAASAAEAYARIATSQSRFLSRGDDSGTHQRERAIWKCAGIVPRGAWYVTTGQFMASTLRQANAQKAYFMTDSSTWIALRDDTPDLKVLFRGDPSLVNVYHALTRPQPGTPAGSLAAKFVDFLAGEEAQQLLRSFGMERFGESLYRDARHAREFESAASPSPAHEASPPDHAIPTTQSRRRQNESP